MRQLARAPPLLAAPRVQAEGDLPRAPVALRGAPRDRRCSTAGPLLCWVRRRCTWTRGQLPARLGFRGAHGCAARVACTAAARRVAHGRCTPGPSPSPSPSLFDASVCPLVLPGTEGFHVLKVWPNSPGAKAGLEPFFDFIIGVNGIRLVREQTTGWHTCCSSAPVAEYTATRAARVTALCQRAPMPPPPRRGPIRARVVGLRACQRPPKRKRSRAFCGFLTLASFSFLQRALLLTTTQQQDVDSEQLKVKCSENIDKPVKLIVYSSKNQASAGAALPPRRQPPLQGCSRHAATSSGSPPIQAPRPLISPPPCPALLRPTTEQDIREIEMIPTNTWGGQGELPARLPLASPRSLVLLRRPVVPGLPRAGSDLIPCPAFAALGLRAGLLGLSIRFCSFEGASECVWHVLDVSGKSPADLAGLQANLDYIIAADTAPLDERDDLCVLRVLRAHASSGAAPAHT